MPLNATHCYIGRGKCACVLAAVVDEKDRLETVAEDVSGFIKSGLTIERVPLPQMKNIFLGHRCQKIPDPPELTIATGKVYKCAVCGFTGPWGGGGKEWAWYGSILDEETCPDLLPTLCSMGCRDEFDRRLKAGTVKLPKVKHRHGAFISYDEREGKGWKLSGYNSI